MKTKPLLATGSLAALALLAFSLTATEPAESSQVGAVPDDLVAPDYVSLDVRGEPLKSAFNADADKVRLLMLVAPT
ncbi:MAG: hypothetical protein O6851_02260 [Gemmatimonadetes bacterium]|nr:hypothetical protein [Gemmatimonadota bacterium]